MKRRTDRVLFNDYIREPLPVVIIALVVGIVFLVLAVWSSAELFFPAIPDCTMSEVEFVSYKHDGPVYMLYSSDGSTYDLPVKAINDTSILDYIVNSKSLYFVEHAIPGDDSRISLDIISISTSDGKHIIPSENIAEARKHNGIVSTVIMWATCLMYWGLIVIAYHILSNAPRYPRIAALLVRKSFRKF